MKALFAREESTHPHLFANILHAIRPIMTEGAVPGDERPGSEAQLRVGARAGPSGGIN